MDGLRVFWAINMLAFALVLLFVWAKVYMIGRKLNSILGLIARCEELSVLVERDQKTPDTPAEPEQD